MPSLLSSAQRACRRRFRHLGPLALLTFASFAALLTEPLLAADTPEQAFQQIYAEQLKKARTTPATEDNRLLGAQLIQDAVRIRTDLPLMAYMYHQAIALSIEDPAGGVIAQLAAEHLVNDIHEPVADVWEVLCASAVDTLTHQRAKGDDPRATFACDWLLQLAGIYHQAGDTKATDRTLATALRETKSFKFKYLSEQILQLQARLKLETAADAALKTTLAKFNNPAQADDPKNNLAATETILCQTGDWAAADPYRQKAQHPVLDQIYAARTRRKAPAGTILDAVLEPFPAGPPLGAGHTPKIDPRRAPAPAPAPAAAAPAATPTAAKYVEYADYLIDLTKPQHRPSAAGKASLLTEAAALYSLALKADDTDLSTVQKLKLVTQARTVSEDASKAQTALRAAIGGPTQQWMNLQQGNLTTDWSSRSKMEKWKIDDTGTLSITGDNNWFNALHSKRATFHDFVFETEFRTVTPKTTITFFFGDYEHHPFYFLNLIPDAYALMVQEGPGSNKRNVGQGRYTIEAESWHTFRAVFEGDRRRFWIDGQPLYDAIDPIKQNAFAPGINALDGTGEFRNLRIRELK